MGDWTLEIALTDLCDRNCFYCSFKNYFPYSVMNVQNVLKIIYAANEAFGLKEVVYTGGEPLLSDNLPLLVQKTGEMYPKELVQIIMTDACDFNVIKNIVNRKNSPLCFRVTLPFSDFATMNRIVGSCRKDELAGENRISEVDRTIAFLEEKGILTQIHYPLIRGVNNSMKQIEEMVGRYIHNCHISVCFDELACDQRNKLKPSDYRMTKRSFENVIFKMGFSRSGEETGRTKYSRDGKAVYFCQRETKSSLAKNRNIYVTPDGYIRKNGFFEERPQIQITDYRSVSILRDMVNLKKGVCKDSKIGE